MNSHVAGTTTSVVDETALRNVLGHFATGVVVVTAHTSEGPCGMTCQPLVSVSLQPPLVSFCPAKSSRTWPHIQRAGTFCVNVLSLDQERLCGSFARSGQSKFDGVTWSPDRHGSPVLEGALARISCTIERVHDVGDHFLVLARVVDLSATSHDDPAPLLYFRGRFGAFKTSSPGVERSA